MKKRLVFFILCLFALGRCSEKPPERVSIPPKSPVSGSIQSVQQPSKPQPGSPQAPEKHAVPALPEKSGPALATYDPRGKPDPFRPVVEGLPDAKGSPHSKMLPLEQFEISDYELVGIVSGPGLKKAMIQDLSGKGYLVQVGTPIGKRGGKIIRIVDREVVIEETFQDFLGRKSVRQVSLKMPQS